MALRTHLHRHITAHCLPHVLRDCTRWGALDVDGTGGSIELDQLRTTCLFKLLTKAALDNTERDISIEEFATFVFNDRLLDWDDDDAVASEYPWTIICGMIYRIMYTNRNGVDCVVCKQVRQRPEIAVPSLQCARFVC